MALRQQHPDIPWLLMAGMRDKLIHDYDEIDIEEIWKIDNTNIPKRLSSMQTALKSRNNPGESEGTIELVGWVA